MFRERLLIALAVVALVVAGAYVLHAQPADDGQGADFFDRLDANQDGKIDRDEFRGPDEAFARMDANGDGAITRDELAAGGDQAAARRRGQNQGRVAVADPAERWKQMLERFDTNADGQISAEEFQGPEKVLRFFDTNNDGVITEDEVTQAGDRARERERLDPAQRWQRLIENCDADGDGKISAEEWPARPEGFERLDRDGDGFLVEGELVRERVQPGREGRVQRPDPARMIIQMMDASGDGQVSAEEWRNFFDLADVDDDEMISHTELFARFKEALRPQAEQGPVEEPPAPAEGF
ncbi:MAG: EF-hand domain-containing protein [Armatimonadota bacterium]